MNNVAYRFGYAEGPPTRHAIGYLIYAHESAREIK